MSEISVVPARSEWADEYRAPAVQIRSLVGDAASRIDHIGSTSVSGLTAKDVIDVQISVLDLASETVTSTLSENGFRAVARAVDNLVGAEAGSRELQKRFLSLDCKPLPPLPLPSAGCGCSSTVEPQPSKLVVWVRFPSPAPLLVSGDFHAHEVHARSASSSATFTIFCRRPPNVAPRHRPKF